MGAREMGDEEIFADDEASKMPEIISEIGALPPHTLIFEKGLCEIFKRHSASVKRAIARGELPPPIRLFGQPVWTADVINKHFEARFEEAARDADSTARRLKKLEA